MRTTVTLDADVADGIRRLMEAKGIGFKEALNQLVRSGLQDAKRPAPRFRTPTFRLGRPQVDLTHATRLLGELEDDERARRMASGS